MRSPSSSTTRTGLCSFFFVALALASGGKAFQSNSPQGAVQKESGKGLPLQSVRSLKFSVDEGTWISVDASPDGKTLVFDLLGHLYTLPVEGGTAQAITSGLSFDGQPRYSPDGKSIVYVSDRSGDDNLWIVSADGSNPHALTSEDNAMFVSPAWSSDGRAVIVSH